MHAFYGYTITQSIYKNHKLDILAERDIIVSFLNIVQSY